MKNQMVFFEEEFNEDHKKSFQILYCSDHFLSIATNIVLAQEPRVFLRIDKEFFDALNNDKQNLNKAYSNNPKCKSEEYLGHIAVLIKYMEESNIEILKKQGKIIKLLQTIIRGDLYYGLSLKNDEDSSKMAIQSYLYAMARFGSSEHVPLSV